MALTDETLSLIAFKNLLGKSHTDNNKGLGNEAEGIFLNVASSEVFLDEIDSNPATAVSNGVAELVTGADLVSDPTSNGHAFFAEYPTGHPKQGQRIVRAIPPSFGFQYEVKPFDTGASAIPVNDPRDWVYQYNSGVFYQQDNVGADPATIDLYVYVGQTLSDIDFDNLSSGGNNSEWQNSVSTKVSDSSILTPSIGDRYLIIDAETCGAGTNTCLLNDFVGRKDNIAQWEGTSWAFTVPTDGMTVKIDDEDGYVYHYEATTVVLGWLRYSYGQVRVLNGIGDGNGEDYIGTVSPPIDSYREDIIFLTFFNENSGTNGVTINIDGLGQRDVLKEDSGNLVPVDENDLKIGIIYYLAYDGVQFQVSSSVGSTAGQAGVIGPAEDGDYTDGLFTDFTPSTPTGTAVDRFNEVLKELAPPPSPDLSDWDANVSNDVTGKLSFDTANPIGGYVGGDTAPTDPISVDGTWTLGAVSGKRLGIKPVTGDISGILNYQVATGPGSPTPAYPAQTFSDGEKGTISMSLNGVTISTVDLTSTSSAIDATSSGTISGISVSATDFSKFPTGADLDLFIHRSGTWLVVDGEVNLTNGYNYVIVTHNTGTAVKTLDRFEWIIDDSNTATTYSNEILTGLSLSGSVRLSGIEYNNAGSLTYSVDIDNAYRNTYSASASALSHTGSTNTYGTTISAPSSALGANGGNEALQINHSVTGTLTGSGIRLIDESVSLNTTTDRTVQADVTGGLASTGGILLDNVSSSSTEVGVEDFNASETYRLTSNLNYDLTSDILTGAWDSDQSLDDGAAGHTDGLQVTEGTLIYPVTDFRTTAITNSPAFNDGGVGGSARDYSSLSGERTYYRYFRQTSPTTANFIINFAGSGGTFVDSTNIGSLTGNEIAVRIKAPTETGWMDAYADFATGQFGDDDGARSATDGAGRAFNTNWGLTIGTKSTANSGGYVVVEITVASGFAGEFTGITFTFN